MPSAENMIPNTTQPMSEALKTLRKSNGLLPALIANLPGGAVFVVDRDLRYLLAEGEALATAGFKPEDFVGRTIFEVLPPELIASYEPRYRQALAGEPFEQEHNAHNHTYISRGTPLRAENGEIYAVLVVSYDISDRKRIEDEHQQVEAALYKSEERQTFLLTLSDALRSLADPVEIQEAVTQTAMNYFGADRCYYCEIKDGNAIILRDAARGDLPSVAGVYPLSSFPILQAVIDAGRPFVVQDVQTTHTVDHDLRQLCIQLQVISYVDVPVIKNGKPVGVLCLVQSTPRDWTDLEVELAIETANLTWAAVERARAEAAIEADLRATQMLHNLATRLISEEDRQALYQEIVKAAIALTQADAGSFQILDETTQELVIMATQGLDRTMTAHFYRLDASSTTSCGVALTTGERTFIYFDVSESEDPDGSLRMHREAGLCCVQSTPLRSRSGKPIGMVSTHWREDHQLSDRELRFLDLLARQAADIIEQRQAEENRIQLIHAQAAREQERQRAETLAELDRAKTAFFSNVSHEFRTPLTLSLAPLQDALSDRTHPLDPVQRERLELVHRNSLRLLKLVNTLLDFSRIEAGRRSAVYEPTDLATYTAELASVFRSAIEQAGLQLAVDCPPLPELVYVDREMWEKIVLNLLSNAFKFTFEGEITVSLRTESRIESQASTSNIDHLTSDPQVLTSELDLSTSQLQRSSSGLETWTSELETSTSELETLTSELETSTSELETPPLEQQAPTSNLHVILKVHDTGTGIAPEHLPHLFERFYQVRGTQARTPEGSGIGLALVHELVQLHGGTIEVSSTLGKGTCFTIALPFGTKHLPRENRLQSTPTLASTAMGAISDVEEAERWLPTQISEVSKTSKISPPTLASARVLVVDDNADIREYLTRMLSEHLQVEAFADGATAFAAIQAQVPDLILSDVMMPGLDGFELLEALRADPRTREIPIILLSARAGAEAIAEGLYAGADDYLIKPFSAQELISRVNAQLQRSSWRGAALQEARTAIRQKDELLSIVSHELNTPLVSILGWTRLLRTNPQDAAMLSTALDTIERSATMQAKLVQDLLDASRITAGKLRLHLQPTELKAVIDRAIATVTQLAAEAGIQLTCPETTTAVVMGDRERLQQVVCNLLTNAIKFTPAGGNINVSLITAGSSEDGGDRGDKGDGGDRGAISSSSSSPSFPSPPSLENYAEIHVTDTGMGIAPDLLPHIFEQFWQAGGPNSAKGLGLGLAIARHIVELHNGTIQAQSAGEGQGATVVIRLPLLESNSAAPGQPTN